MTGLSPSLLLFWTLLFLQDAASKAARMYRNVRFIIIFMVFIIDYSLWFLFRCPQYLRFPRRSWKALHTKPTVCNIRRMTPLAQYVVNIPLYSYKRKESEIIARSTFLVAFQGESIEVNEIRI